MTRQELRRRVFSSELSKKEHVSIENRGEHSELPKKEQVSIESRGEHSELPKKEQASIESRGEHSELPKKEHVSIENSGELFLKSPSVNSLDFNSVHCPIPSSSHQGAGDTEEKEGDGIMNKKEHDIFSLQSGSRSLKQRELLRRKKQASALLNGSRSAGGEKDRSGTGTETGSRSISVGSISKQDSEEVSIRSELQSKSKEGGEIDDFGPKNEPTSDTIVASAPEGIATSAFSDPFLGLFGYYY